MSETLIDEAKIIASFCTKLKTIRLGNSLTLDELARKSGVSISTISKIENRLQKPSFETVLRVARALQINFIHMLDPPAPPPAHLARRVITRAADAPIYESAYYTYAVHAAELSHKRMAPLLMRIKTRCPPPPDEWSTHDGEEFVYVIEGAVALHSEHYAPAYLNTGDSTYLDSTMRHAYIATGPADALVMAVCLSIKPFADV
jgi:transcriptional regulator with XRE-family HTH domain